MLLAALGEPSSGRRRRLAVRVVAEVAARRAATAD
jgi:hypothetical protein